MDTIFEAMRRSENLNHIGFIKMHPHLAKSYSGISLIQTFDKPESGQEFLHFVQNGMDLLVEYHGLFHEFIDDKGVSIRDLSVTARSTIPENFSTADSVRKAVHLLDELYSGVQKSSDVVQEHTSRMSSELHTLLTEMWQFDQRNHSAGVATQVGDFYFISEFAEPLIAKLVSSGVMGAHAWTTLVEIKHSIYSNLLEDLVERLDNDNEFKSLSDIPIEKYGHLIRIITSLSKLDEVQSYEHLFHTLGQIGLDLDRTELKYLKDVLYYIEAFTVIDRGNDKIQMNVEPLLLKMLSTYESQGIRDFQPYFSVGLGQTLGVRQDSGYVLTLPDGDPIKSLSYASEKLGFKYELINNKKIQSRELWQLNSFQKIF
jgi:hypothetical protein